MEAGQSEAVLKAGRRWAAGLAIAVAAICLVASVVCTAFPARAWATASAANAANAAGATSATSTASAAGATSATSAANPGLQSVALEPMAAADYYAVLHEDGELVFQAQPSSETGATNFAGSCNPYASGKAPWLAKADQIESVRFDESFANTQPESLAYWFINCKNMKSIDLQNLDASASTSMRAMFSGCSSLATIEHLSSFDTSSSTYFGSMFRNCSSLTSIDVSHFDATHVGVLCFMFAGCTNLETLNMAGEGWRTESLYLMVHVWENCSSLKSLDLSYLDTSDVHSMAKDFNGCSSLEYLDLSGADTTNVGSLGGMFDGCSSLATVKFGPKFSFSGMADAPQCSLPEGQWKSQATGAVYASADVPSCVADTYTRDVAASGSGGSTDNPPSGPSDSPDDKIGEYDLPGLAGSLGMFNHFVEGSQKLEVTEDKVALSFVTDGSITMVQNISKVAIGPSSKLINTDDMREGETKWANSLLGTPVVFAGTLVSPEGSPEQYAYELEFDRAEFEQMLARDHGIYLTLYHRGYNAWHKGGSDLLLTLGENGAYDANGNTPGGSGADTPGSDTPGPSGDDVGEVVAPDQIVDGTYAVELTVSPSMIKLAGHDGAAPEPRIVVAGDDAWLVVSYRSSLGSAWRYGEIAWGPYEDVVAAGKDGVGAAPTFKSGKSAADGLSDETLDCATFALPLEKSDLVAWLASGEERAFTVRYVDGYSSEHDGEWWKPASVSQSTLTLGKVRIAKEPADVPADYAAVLDALAEVPANLGAYTEASARRLESALVLVTGSPKSVADQAAVDAMAKAVSDAVEALETKEAAAAREAAEKAAIAERLAAAEKVTAESAATAKAAAARAAAAERRAAEAEKKSATAEEAAASAEKVAAAAKKKADALAKKAAAAKRDAAAKKVTNVTVNAKTVTAKTVAKAISAAKGKAKYVKTITLGKKVRKIAKGAFKRTKATTIVIKTKKLTKKSVKGSLAGSKVKTVKVSVGKAKANKKYAKKYKKYFAKKKAKRAKGTSFVSFRV